MNRSSHLIIDVSFCMYRMFHAIRKIKADANEDPKQFRPLLFSAIFKDLVYWKEMFNCRNIIFAFDSRSIRYDIFPDYKKSRKDKRANYTNESKDLHKMFHVAIRDLEERYLPRMGFMNVLRKVGWEADDIIAYLCKFQLSKLEKKIIVSADSDMNQLLNSNTMIYNPISKKVTNEKSFMEKTGIHPNQWNVYRALVGGKDNVPGVEGIGAVTATKYIQGKLKDCLAIKTIAKNAEKLQSIIELVTLPINHPSLTTSWLKNVPRRDTANREKWEMFCDKMRLREIRRKRLEGNNG